MVALLGEAVGARGRAPGCGGGGREGSAVVVAGVYAGVVRVGGRFCGVSWAVWGVMPSGLAATMGSFLCIEIGGMLDIVRGV